MPHSGPISTRHNRTYLPAARPVGAPAGPRPGPPPYAPLPAYAPPPTPGAVPPRPAPPPVDYQPVPVWPRQPSSLFTPTGAVLFCMFGPDLLIFPALYIFNLATANMGFFESWDAAGTYLTPIIMALMAVSYFFYFRAYFRAQPWHPMYDFSGYLMTREVAGVRYVYATRSFHRSAWIPAEQWLWLPRLEYDQREAERVARQLATAGVFFGLTLMLHSLGRRR